MAPVRVTDDYYAILAVEQIATTEAITKSYRRLAFVLHPDRNPRSDATAAFQLLGRAYGSLKDEARRRSYDIIYPSITSNSSNKEKPPPKTQSLTSNKPNPETSIPKSKQGDIGDSAAIAALRKVRDERDAKWRPTAKRYEDVIFEQQREVTRFKKDIEKLDDIKLRELAEEAAARSWSAWIFSPLYKKSVETGEEKERKSNERLDRFHSKNVKERVLKSKMTILRKWEKGLRDGQDVLAKAHEIDNENIRFHENRIRVRRERELEEERRKEELVRDEARKKEREKREREEAEHLRRYQAAQKLRQEQEAGARKLREEEMAHKMWEDAARVKRMQECIAKVYEQQQYQPPPVVGSSRSSRRQPERGSCNHDGWWPKVEAETSWNRLQCEECGVAYSYLLICPGCRIEAYASCQRTSRPVRRGLRRTRPGYGNTQTQGSKGHTYDHYDEWSD
ncbi:DnaJ domain-containing protein [Leptodontidium sp. 2 PMI_412]|nr:DnaJ domain-containing protein [Leptodontidium sp. 2 PMI_412]